MNYHTLHLMNLLNRIVQLPFLEFSIVNLENIKMRIWLANSIKPGQTAWMCRLTWLYAGGKGLSLLVPQIYEFPMKGFHAPTIRGLRHLDLPLSVHLKNF